MIKFFALVVVPLCTFLTQVLLKQATKSFPAFAGAADLPQFVLAFASSPLAWAAVVIQGTGFILWAVVVSQMRLGVAFAMAGASFYILLALFSWWIWGERLSPPQWIGIGLVAAGVAILGLYSE